MLYGYDMWMRGKLEPTGTNLDRHNSAKVTPGSTFMIPVNWIQARILCIGVVSITNPCVLQGCVSIAVSCAVRNH